MTTNERAYLESIGRRYTDLLSLLTGRPAPAPGNGQRQPPLFVSARSSRILPRYRAVRSWSSSRRGQDGNRSGSEPMARSVHRGDVARSRPPRLLRERLYRGTLDDRAAHPARRLASVLPHGPIGLRRPPPSDWRSVSGRNADLGQAGLSQPPAGQAG